MSEDNSWPDDSRIALLPGGTATSPQRFKAAAVSSGVKRSGKLDLAVLVSELNCAAAGVFTKNQVAAAPVILDRETLKANNSSIRAVVTNAGNANACTGEPGMDAAKEIWERLGLPPLKPEAPWHGYELGHWPQDLERQARMATASEYFELGAELAIERRGDVKMNAPIERK